MESEFLYVALVLLVLWSFQLHLKVRGLKKRIDKLSSELEDQHSRLLELEIERDFGGEKGERIIAIKNERIRVRQEAAELRTQEKAKNEGEESR